MTTHADRLLRCVRRIASQAGPEPDDAGLLTGFLSGRDPVAFEALVARHGSMVLQVCQRVLGNGHDAEDAFQATFLILARKAASVRPAGALAAWLHGVAYRVALRARAVARRRRRESPTPNLDPPDPRPDPLSELTAREALLMLEEEVQRLPEAYRLPVILCCLEGLSQDEAARRLAWTPGSVKGRLERGRARLHARLTRRGLTLAAALAALEVSRAVAAPAAATAQAALAFAAGRGTGAGVPAGAARLALEALAVSRPKVAALLLILGMGLAAVTAGTLAHQGSAPASPGAAPTGPPAQGERPRADAGPQARADRYGDPFPAGAVARLGTVRFRPSSGPARLAFTPGGKALVVAGEHSIYICDATTGAEIHYFDDSTHSTRSPSISSDGRLVAGVGARLRVWKAATGQLVQEVSSPRADYRAASLAPDGKLLGAWAADGTLELWDVTTGHRLRAWHGLPPSSYTCWMLFAADGKTLLTGDDDRVVRFWDVATGAKVRELAGAGPSRGSLLALSADGTLLASVGMRRVKEQIGDQDEFRRIHIWDLVAGKAVRQLAMPAEADSLSRRHGVYSLAFSSDSGALAAAGGADGNVWLWDPATGNEIARFPVGGRVQGGLAFAPDGKRLAVQVGGAIRLFDLPGGPERGVPAEHRHAVTALALTPDGRTLASAAGGPNAGWGDHTIVLWDPATGRVRRRLEGHADHVSALALGPDGHTLLSAGCDSTVRVWDLNTGEERNRWAVDQGEIASPPHVAISPDGRRLAVTLPGGTVALLDAASGREVNRLIPGTKYGIYHLAFTTDGRTLVISATDSLAHLWDVSTGKDLRQIPFYEDPDHLVLNGEGLDYWTALSPDGRLLAFGGQKNYLALYNLATGREVRRMGGLPLIRSLTFSPDGRMLAWGGYRDGVIGLVELATGRERCRLAGHRGNVTALTFRADGRELISGGEDTTVLVWDLTGRVGEPVAWGRPLAPSELEALWDDLAAEDAARAFRAVQRLAAAPAHAVPFLARRLRPAEPADSKRVARLIADLDSDQFRVREAAGAELEQLGEAGTGACQEALNGRPSAEVRRRLEALLDRQRGQQWYPSADRRRAARAPEVLERADTPEARQLLGRLARGVAEAYLTREAKASLERLSKRCYVNP
jgi:RNA polymerase sigma factor (sigma-70 family)